MVQPELEESWRSDIALRDTFEGRFSVIDVHLLEGFACMLSFSPLYVRVNAVNRVS